PEATAVVYEGEKLSYGELNRRANQLGHYLRELGVGPEKRGAICVERGLEVVMGVLGVWKAGGADVPVDPGDPEERLRYMLEDSGPVALLIQGDLRGRLGEIQEGVAVVELEEAEGEGWRWTGHPGSNLDPAGIGLRSDDLAYVIYTSGS